MILTMAQLTALGIDSVNGLFAKVHRVKIEDIRKLDPQSKEIAVLCDDMTQALVNRKNCKDCKESLEKTGCVCDSHFHDYGICDDAHCMACFLVQCYFRHNPQDEEELYIA